MPIREIFDTVSLWIIPAIILIVLTVGVIKKLPIYELFVEGAKDGAKVGFNIFPYLVAIIIAISMLRASGAIEDLGSLLSGILSTVHIPVDVLPIMIVRSLSGSAVLGILGDIASSHEVNSYVTRLSAIMVGSSETTLYVLAVYFGSIGIKKYRHALLTGLLADVVGICAAVLAAYKFFG